MSLKDAKAVTKELLAQVEEKTRLPVIVKADPSLGTLATAQAARQGAASHVVLYNPKIGRDADYAICLQSASLLRTILTPEADRFDFGATSRGRQEVHRLLEEHLRGRGLSLPAPALGQLGTGLFVGLMLHLRSVPIGLRVDAWLGREYPELAAQQKSFARRQLEDDLMLTTSQIRQVNPEKVYRSIVAMNAAFAAYWAKAWSDPVPAAPYRQMGHLSAGEALLKLWYDVPDDPAHDRKLVESWGEALGLQGWYEIVPFEKATQ